MRSNLLFAWLLAAIAVPAVAQQPAKPASRKHDPDAVRCVKLPVTGSLVQTRRTCMTNREWEQQRDDARRMQSLVCSNGTQCAGR